MIDFLVRAAILVGLVVQVWRFIRNPRLYLLLFFIFWVYLFLLVFVGLDWTPWLALVPLVAGWVARSRGRRAELLDQLEGLRKELKAKSEAEPDIAPVSGSGPQPKEEPRSPQDFINQIPSLAESCMRLSNEHFQAQLAFEEDGFRMVDQIIDEGWPDGPPVMLDQMCASFGAYVGENIRRQLGGEWSYDESTGYQLGRIGGTSARVFPFSKVRKRFEQGEGDSIAFYYAAIKDTVEKEKAKSAG